MRQLLWITLLGSLSAPVAAQNAVLDRAYGINKQWSVGFTWLIDNKAGEKAFKGEGGALEYDRVMLDTVFKY